MMQDLIDFLKQGFAPDLLGAVTSGLRAIVAALLDFLYDLIFIELKSASISVGNKILNFFGDTFYSQPFSLLSLAYAFGFIFCIFIVNKAIAIIRG